MALWYFFYIVVCRKQVIGIDMSETREIVSVITCDLEGRIETFNPNAEKLFGYSADEVIGKKPVSYTHLTLPTIAKV